MDVSVSSVITWPLAVTVMPAPACRHEIIVGQVPWCAAAGNFMKANPFDKFRLCINERERHIVCVLADARRGGQSGIATADYDYSVRGNVCHAAACG